MKIRGWVYIIINQSIPNLIKIGYSTKDPSIRAKEFDGTGVPYDYEVIYDALVDNPREVEQLVHRDLKEFNENKEWFNCSISIGINAIKKHSNKIYTETTNENISEKNLSNKKFIKCIKCNGKGLIKKPTQYGTFWDVQCEECNGKGEILDDSEKKHKKNEKVKCPTCSGNGQIKLQQGFFSVEQICPKCNGLKEI